MERLILGDRWHGGGLQGGTEGRPTRCGGQGLRDQTAPRHILRPGAGPAPRCGGGITSHNAMQHIAPERQRREPPLPEASACGERQDQAALYGASVMRCHRRAGRVTGRRRIDLSEQARGSSFENASIRATDIFFLKMIKEVDLLFIPIYPKSCARIWI
jgi:hypothetical protein